MTTETTPDPAIEAWSDRLEEQLGEAGMEPPQARAYRLAFELGLTRVISQVATKQELMATKQELRDGLAGLRRELAEQGRRIEQMATKQELRDGLAELRRELAEQGRRIEQMATKQELRDGLAELKQDLQRELEIRGRYLIIAMTIGFGILTGLMGAILSKL